MRWRTLIRILRFKRRVPLPNKREDSKLKKLEDLLLPNQKKIWSHPLWGLLFQGRLLTSSNRIICVVNKILPSYHYLIGLTHSIDLVTKRWGHRLVVTFESFSKKLMKELWFIAVFQNPLILSELINHHLVQPQKHNRNSNLA